MRGLFLLKKTIIFKYNFEIESRDSEQQKDKNDAVGLQNYYPWFKF